MAKTFAEHIEEIKREYEFHSEEARKFKALLDAAGISLTTKTNGYNVPAKNEIPLLQQKKPTFESYIVEILKEGDTPRLTRELQEEYKKKTGIELISKNFSSKLSIAAAKTHPLIKNYEFKQFPSEIRFWWGLTDFFKGQKFKPEYEDKILVKVGYPNQEELPM